MRIDRISRFIYALTAALLLSVGAARAVKAEEILIPQPSEKISYDGPETGSIMSDDPAERVGITEIRFGCDDNARSGRYIPVVITLQNRMAEDFDGQICITSGEGDAQNRYLYRIAVSGGEEKKFSCYIPLESGTDTIGVRLSDSRERIIEEQTVQLGTEQNNARLFAGILSDTPEKMKYLDDVPLNYGLIRTKLFDLEAEAFPNDSKGLDIFDVIVVSNYSIRNLDEIQTRALMDWVREGGVLILGTGLRADDTLGRFAPELLDDMYEEPETVSVDFGPDFGTENPGDAVIELPFIDASLHGGNTVIQGENGALVTTVNKGSGLIAVTGFDLADISEFAMMRPGFTQTFVERLLGRVRIERLTAENYGGGSDKAERVSRLMDTGSDRLPPITIYAFSVLAYILLAGPGLYVFLKHREMSRYYRPGVAALSLFFALIIFLIGTRTRYQGTYYSYALIKNAGEDSMTEIGYLNLTGPVNRTCSALLSPEYSVYPVQGGKTENRETGKAGVSIGYDGSATKVELSHAGIFNSGTFEVERSLDNPDGAGFTGYVQLYADELSGEITNDFPEDVQDAVIMFFGKMAVIGDMKSGETRDLSLLELIDIPLSDSEAVSAYICGLKKQAEGSLPDAGYLKDLRRTRLYAFYRDGYLNGYTADACVFAAADIPEEQLLMGKEMEGSGMTLLTSFVSVDARKDEMLCRSVLIRDPSVISGRYTPETNVMETREPAVLEYQLGGDTEPRIVHFDWPDAVISEGALKTDAGIFTGSMAFYNYNTGSYDYMDIQKSVYTREELEGYLSPSDTITIKYTYAGPEKTTSLCMISTEGTER